MYHKKIKSNNEEFHKGFYENMKEDIPNQLMKIEDCNPKEEFKRQGCRYNAELFLHGLCHVFAYALNQKYGYDILELKSKYGTTVHWCCVTEYNGKKLYIDVRGATTDYDELLSEFQPNIGTKPSKKKIVNLANYKDEWEEDIVKFANEIITKYCNYYSLY